MERFYGIITALISLFCMGIWHPIVIKGEYYFGKRVCAPVFLAVGVICMVCSVLCSNLIVSIALALFGICSLWAIFEVIKQEDRVKRGWFPKRNQSK